MISSYATQYLKPVEARQHDVEKDQIRAFVGNTVKRPLAIDGLNHGVPFALKVLGQ